MNRLPLLSKFEQIRDYWTPKLVGEFHGRQLKLAKLKGEFIRHHHALEDKAFLF